MQDNNTTTESTNTMNENDRTAELSPMPESPATSAGDKPFPCDVAGCDRVGPRGFDSIPARTMHRIRMHGKGWDTSANFRKARKSRRKVRAYRFPSEQPGYKKRKYAEKVAEYHAQGLNAHGDPFKTEWGRRLSKERSGKRSWRTRQRMSEVMKARWAATKLIEAGATLKRKRGEPIDVYHAPKSEEGKLVKIAWSGRCPNCDCEIALKV